MSNIANMDAPISRLAPDLLLEMMLAYKHVVEEEQQIKNYWDPLERPWELFPTYKWIGITFVCHDWRVLALSSPVLWGSIHIPRAGLEWAGELLKRSHPAPISTLSLRRWKSSIDISRYISLFAGDHGKGRKIRRLHVELKKEYLDWNPSDLSPLVLDDVKELTIYRALSREDLARHPPKAFVEFFATCSFKLESLILYCSIWDRRYLHDTLTKLVLVGTHQGNPMNWDDFIFALGTMKNLRELYLDEVLSNLSPSTSVQAIRITLPHLKSLILREDDLESHVKFLESVSIPQEAITSLYNKTNSIEEYISAIPSFSRVLSHSPPSLPHRYLELDLRFSYNFVHLQVAVETDVPLVSGFVKTRRINPNLIHCVISNSVQSLDAVQRTSELLGSLQLNHIQTIYITGAGVNKTSLVGVLASLPMLDTLELNEQIYDFGTSRALASALPACPHCFTDHTFTPPLSTTCEDCKTARKAFFPSLRTIKYLCIAADSMEKEKKNEYLALITTFLSFMAYNGRKLVRLEFRSYGFHGGPEGWNERLVPLCDSIAWFPTAN